MKNSVIRVAILDMYNGSANEGMRCIREILQRHPLPIHTSLEYSVFDVRKKEEIPGTEYDIYISSGGPGSPLKRNTSWEKKYLSLIDSLLNHNLRKGNKKKHVFFICHSFQLICDHWELAQVCKRKSPAYGIFPVHHTKEGARDSILKKLPEPFYAVDSRDYQVISPDKKRVKEFGATVLCIEKDRPHVPLERATMAIRFSPEFFGAQFHPEADAPGMKNYFRRPGKKQSILRTHGEAKFNEMVSYLNDPGKIELTQSIVIPAFLDHAVNRILQDN